MGKESRDVNRSVFLNSDDVWEYERPFSKHCFHLVKKSFNTKLYCISIKIIGVIFIAVAFGLWLIFTGIMKIILPAEN